MGNQCLASGNFACAQENLEAAYASVGDPGARSDLYRYYLIKGDNWQHNGELDLARQLYSKAVSLDPARPEATERLQRLTGYSAVELFYPFEAFNKPGLNETSEDGTTVYRIANGVLELSSTVPGSATTLAIPGTRSDWDTRLSSEYAVTAEVAAMGPSTVVGIVVARDPANAGYHFLVDPVLQQWWIEYYHGDGSWTDLVLPQPFAGLIQGPVEQLEVRVTNGTPTFLVNDVEVTASFDLAWMHIPPTGECGVTIESSPANPTATRFATFESFGIYAR
jgi:hypothetical protein